MEVGESVEIQLEDECVGPDDIWFHVIDTHEGLDLTLYVRGLTNENERFRGLGATLLAEHAVGERDALTLLQFGANRAVAEAARRRGTVSSP